MQPRSRKIAVFVGSAALATGVGVAVAAQGDSTSSSQAAPMSRQADGRPGGGMDLSALGEQLGVTTDKLQAAMDTARATAQDPDEMAAALAKELGLAEDDVTAALESMRPDGTTQS
jgi:hypothetical protein